MSSMRNRIVNAIVGLMATGGSTNHALHLPAMAQAAGIIVDWNDFSDISSVTPLLARVYPNGTADVNQFHAAGGMAFITRELLLAGLLHGDTDHSRRRGPRAPTRRSHGSTATRIAWRDGARRSRWTKPSCARSRRPFEMEGGIRLLTGQSRPRRHQDLVRPAGSPHHRCARRRVRKPGRLLRRLQGRQARPRCRRRRPLPGPARQRHAGAARADAAAHRAAEQGLPRRPRHRRAHVRRVGRDAGRDPRDARRRSGFRSSPASRMATASCWTPSMAVST